MIESQRIPKERVKVIFGQNGFIKKKIEKFLNCRLTLLEENFVQIEGEDSLDLWKARMVVEGIGRGFEFKEVSCLKNDEYMLRVIHLPEVLGKRESTLKRFKGRLIGTQGKIKKEIEEKTKTKIVISGKTVSIVGIGSGVHTAEHAIELILKGKKFGTLFRYLQNAKVDEE